MNKLTIFLTFILIFMGGCKIVPDWLSGYLDALTKVDQAKEEKTAIKEMHVQANAELLQEMLRVIFVKNPDSLSQFHGWLQVLNQGASIEGVYNGLTHSSYYRNLETQNRNSAPRALRVFSAELAEIEIELKKQTEFTEESAGPLPRISTDSLVSPENMVVDGVSTLEFPALGDEAKKEEIKKPDIHELIKKYQEVFLGASLFTMKRILCDEALKLIGEKSEYPEKLALWYSAWAPRMSKFGVDFGLGLRNSNDKNFHYTWALSASKDRLSWEVINRLQRLMNKADETQ